MTLIQKWVRFFREAGIEDESSATYADSFSTNRMDMTMLSDLNRDNLAFLGITILGDVIKVTKHAKVVAEKLNTDRILNDSPEAVEKLAALVKTKKIKTKREVSPLDEEESSPPHSQSSLQSRKRKLILKSDDCENSKSLIKSEPIAKVSVVSSRLGPAPSTEDNNPSKSSVFKRLGETDTSPAPVKVAKKTIFDRLDKIKMESESIKVDLDKPSSRVVTTSGPTKIIKDETRLTIVPNRGIKEEPRSTIISTRGLKEEGRSTIVIQSRAVKEESRSAFQRLQAKPDSTQVPKVSSTNESFSLTSDPKGILKQRKPAMFKSKSTSSIISLKSRESEERDAGGKKRKIRVSFGSNEYRAVSPRKGIKSRLWGGAGDGEGEGGGGSSGGEAESSEGEDEELKDVKFNKSLQAAQVDDLRMNINRKQEAKQKDESTSEVQETKKTSGGDLRINISNTRANLTASTASVKQQTAVVRNQTAVVRTQAAAIKQTASSVTNKDVIPLKKVEKKIFVLRKMSDGTQRKVEIDANDPRYQRYRMEVAQESQHKIGTIKQEIKQEPEKLTIKSERSSLERVSTLNTSMKSRLSPAVIRQSAAVTTRVSPALMSRLSPTVKPNLLELKDERIKKRDSYETEEEIREVRKIKYGVSDESENESDEEEWQKKLKMPRLGMVAERDDIISKIKMQRRQVQDQELRDLQVVKVSAKPAEDKFASRQSYAHLSIVEPQRAHADKSQRTLGDRMRGFSHDRTELPKKQRVSISFDDESKSTRYDEIERELARKQNNISRLQTTIDQGNKILSRTTSEPAMMRDKYATADRPRYGSDGRDDRVRHDSNDRSRRQQQSALVDSSRLGGVRRSLSSNDDDYRRDDNRRLKGVSLKPRGGTMIADKEQSKPAIEDRLAVNKRSSSSRDRSRSRSPQVIRQTNLSRSSRESSSRERDNGGSRNNRVERGGSENYGNRNNSSKNSVKKRLG